MGKFCAKCGSKMESDATFCSNCGSSNEGVTKVENNSNGGQASNGMATAGFVLSFFVPVLGLIFSIVGLNKAKYLNGAGKGLAKAGLILSIIWIALEVVAVIFYYVVILAAATGVSSGYYY